ncbi:hypothetical protein EVAR_93886_1 [Eumeta japonica]|uniref:Uncharacterized protein n=1 Tax=Eumeta variegata TaxID=151549 RepID=A0A4C1TWP9_EUMVA|nr:hypothetical protein EVAR_93886_1 [Eumeta japonica]
MKLGSIRWKCDFWVMSMECRWKIDVVTIMKENDLKGNIQSRVENGMLRWFDHLQRKKESRMTKEIYGAYACDGKVDKKHPKKSQADRIGGTFKKG